ncbi:MAG TPA: hypothetical protein VJ276_15840 [Thermoanaerobaculia bacterium]|nr:hypothetical protein [Thermoanaerobaculia bacterium]
MNLDHELRAALQRKTPAPGLAERVLARAGEAPRKPRRVQWAVAASLILTASLAGWTAHRRAEGERAREQVLLAMRIAGSKVAYAQQQVRGISK